MDAFEKLIATLLDHDGFWVKQSYKVGLTKEEKIKIGRPSAPRWELDIIAYKPAKNELWVVECKSYLDSYGVQVRNFLEPGDKDYYKLFNEPVLRETVFYRLCEELRELGLVQKNPTVTLCLAAGHIKENANRSDLEKYFKRNNWILLDENWIIKSLEKASTAGYEDDAAFVVSKILERNRNMNKTKKSTNQVTKQITQLPVLKVL